MMHYFGRSEYKVPYIYAFNFGYAVASLYLSQDQNKSVIKISLLRRRSLLVLSGHKLYFAERHTVVFESALAEQYPRLFCGQCILHAKFTSLLKGTLHRTLHRTALCRPYNVYPLLHCIRCDVSE